MKISSVNIQQANQSTKYGRNKQKVNFNGNFLFRRGLPTQKQYYEMLAREELVNYVRYYFPKGAVKKINVNNNLERNNMLLQFAKKLVSETNGDETKIANGEQLFKEVSEVIRPKNEAQKLILRDTHFSTDDFKTLTKYLNSRGNIKLTENLLNLRDINGVSIDFSKTLEGLLKMPEAQKLNKDFYKYESYIILHANDEKFLENLGNELIQNGKNIPYDELDRIVYIKKKQIVSPLLNRVSEKALMTGNYEAIDFLATGYTAQTINQLNDISEDGIKFLEYFISTSNSANVGTRINFLKNNISHARQNQPFNDIKLLFEKIDDDKNIQKVVDKFLNDKKLANNMNIKEILFYIDKFGSAALTENADNLINILKLSLRNTPDEKVAIIEKNLKNKYYITPYEISSQEYEERFYSNSAQIKGRLRRSINTFLEKISGPFPETKRLNDIKFEDFRLDNETVTEAVLPEKLVKQASLTVKLYPQKKIVREYKSENPKISARKLKIFNEGQEIIKSRMKSAAQIQEQARDYSLTATKMRNKYLNELFNYVSDVRKTENRAKIRKHSVSNYDVLELYQKINGYNEKEFRTMLKAKNENGERIYSFEEINNMLDNSIVEHHRLLREKQAAKKKTHFEQAAIA